MPITVDGTTFGDTAGELVDHARAQSQTIDLSSPSNPATLVGDALVLAARATGGDDLLALTAFAMTRALGDAETITDLARGGDDTISAVGLGNGPEVYGDALTIAGHGRGGDDYVEGQTQAGSSAFVFGDARLLTDHAAGGNDHVTGGPSVSEPALYGDAEVIEGHARGGDDTLSAASGNAAIFRGDAQAIADHGVGGDDLLIAPVNPVSGTVTEMVGDAYQMTGAARGGDDTLVSAVSSPDLMWGDGQFVEPTVAGGRDMFVFAPPNGHDQIMDFEPGKDRIELNGFGFASFQDLASLFQTTSNGVLISFDPNDDILVWGATVSQLTAGDFVFG